MTRSECTRRWGVPTDQVGSANEPRSEIWEGQRWNEKWVYREPAGRDRVVLWYRNDWVGVYRVAEDGRLEADLTEAS